MAGETAWPRAQCRRQASTHIAKGIRPSAARSKCSSRAGDLQLSVSKAMMGMPHIDPTAGRCDVPPHGSTCSTMWWKARSSEKSRALRRVIEAVVLRCRGHSEKSRALRAPTWRAPALSLARPIATRLFCGRWSRVCRRLTEVDGVWVEWATAPQEIADILARELAIRVRQRGCPDAA